MTVHLSDDGFNFRNDAHFEILTHLYYPNAVDARSQAMMLFRSELDKYQTLGSNWVPSDISSKILESIEKRSGQFAVVGLTAIVLAMLNYLSQGGVRATLHRAALIVDAFIEVSPKFDFVTFSKGVKVTKSFPLTLGVNEISKLYRSHRTVAHICAAQLSCAEFFETDPLLGWGKEAIGCFCLTVADFQEHLKITENAMRYTLVDIAGVLPREAREYVPLRPSMETTDALIWPAIQKGIFTKLKAAPL